MRSWYTVAVLACFYALSIVDRLLMSISIGPIRHTLGLSDFKISLMLGLAFAMFYSLFGLPLGALVDRWPRRWIIFAGICLWSLAAAGSGLATTGVQLFCARMLVGAGESALSPAAHSMISDLFPPDRLAAPISIYTMGGTLGSALSLFLGGWLLTYFTAHGGLDLPLLGHREPWQALFVVCGIPGLALTLLIFTIREPPREHRKPELASDSEAGFLRFLQSQWQLLSLLLLGFGAATMLTYGLPAWIPSLMMRNFHRTPAEAGLTYGAVLAVCGISAHSLNGFVVDRMFRKGRTDAHLLYYIVTAAAVAPVVIIGLLSGRWVWLIVAITIAHLVLTPFSGFAAAAIQIITPSRYRGKMAALFICVISTIGLGLGPSFVAALSDYFFRAESRLDAALALFIAVCTGLAILLLFAARSRLRAAMREVAAGATPVPNEH